MFDRIKEAGNALRPSFVKMPRSESLTLPAVFLCPAEDDLSGFAPKLLSLSPDGLRVPIARACKDDPAKQAATDNGFIESSVVSRLHAFIWAEGGKVIEVNEVYPNLVGIRSERSIP